MTPKTTCSPFEFIEPMENNFDDTESMQLGHVVITGGMGFIGYNLARQLCRTNACSSLTLLDLQDEPNTAGEPSLLSDSRVHHVKRSILDPDTYKEVRGKVDHIVHAAGFLGIDSVATQSIHTLDTNIEGTRLCLKYAATLPSLNRLLTFSTSEIYGPKAAAAYEAQDAVVPSQGSRWCYAASKLTAEQYTRAYSREHGVPFCIVRPFNVFGEYRRGSNAMSRFIEVALSNERIYLSGNGEQMRAWCHIQDFVDGIIRMLALPGGHNETFNIGNPENYCSIRDLAKLVVRLTESKSDIKATHTSIEDVVDRRPSITKARTLLDFAPSIKLDDGVERTIHWVRSTTDRNPVLET